MDDHDPEAEAEAEWEREREREIQQYSSGGGIGNPSHNGKLSWTWMLRLGRKILGTGILISSAPLFLPPLVAISAVGLFCSLPYGLFLVSYSCTQTVMTRLLPMHSPTAPAPFLLEYDKTLIRGEEEEEANGDPIGEGQNEVITGGFNIEREEEELKKKDGVEEVEMRIELVYQDEKEEELDRGNILQQAAYQKGGAEPEIDDKKSREQVDEIVEDNMYGQDHAKVSNDKEEKPSQSFEVQVVEITEPKAEQTVMENIKSEQGADEDHGVEAVSKGNKKQSSNIEKETPLQAENVEGKEELGSEMRQSVENVDSPQRKQRKKAKSKTEGTTKGQGEQSIKENVNEQAGDGIHSFLTTVEGDKKERDELKNVADHVEDDKRDRKSRGSLEINRREGQSSVAGEDKLVLENEKVDSEVKLFGDGSMTEQPMEEVCNIVVEFEGDKRNGCNIDKETPFQTRRVDVQFSKSPDIEEDEELVRETRGLLEKVRDDGKTDYAVHGKHSTGKEHVGAEKDDKNIVGDLEMARTAHDEMGNPTTEFEPKVEENKADNKVQMKESVRNLDVFSKEMQLGKDAESSEEMMVDNIPGKAQSAGPVSETVSDGSSRKELTVKDTISLEGGQAEDVDDKNADPNYLLNKENKDVVLSNEDKREINEEEGLDLLENLSTVSQQGSPSDVNTSEESQPSSSYLVYQEDYDSSKLPVSVEAQESDDIQISDENAIDTASDEALYGEEKIWEQINSLRTIVGYKATRQETSMEELKALYLFTGIEPPSSFKDISDLAEVNAKLRFLMSVIGVK